MVDYSIFQIKFTQTFRHLNFSPLATSSPDLILSPSHHILPWSHPPPDHICHSLKQILPWPNPPPDHILPIITSSTLITSSPTHILYSNHIRPLITSFSWSQYHILSPSHRISSTDHILPWSHPSPDWSHLLNWSHPPPDHIIYPTHILPLITSSPTHILPLITSSQLITSSTLITPSPW